MPDSERGVESPELFFFDQIRFGEEIRVKNGTAEFAGKWLTDPMRYSNTN